VILERGKVSPEGLSDALAAARAGEKAEVVALLEKAGAKPHPTVTVDPAILATYAGAYAGEGFDIKEIEHAAFANPPDQPTKHMERRQELGLRPGGFGIMLASQVIDELVYNEKHNELIFVKYIEAQ